MRGRKRFLFDFSLTVPFEVASNGGTYKGSYVLGEISNDEDYEVSCCCGGCLLMIMTLMDGSCSGV